MLLCKWRRRTTLTSKWGWSLDVKTLDVTKTHDKFFISRRIIFLSILTYDNMTLLRKISLKISVILVRKKRKLNFYLLRLFQMQLKSWPRKDQNLAPYTGLTCIKSHKIHFSINLSAHLEELLKRLVVTLNTRTIKAMMTSQNEFWSWEPHPTGWLIVRQTVSL